MIAHCDEYKAVEPGVFGGVKYKIAGQRLSPTLHLVMINGSFIQTGKRDSVLYGKSGIRRCLGVNRSQAILHLAPCSCGVRFPDHDRGTGLEILDVGTPGEGQGKGGGYEEEDDKEKNIEFDRMKNNIYHAEAQCSQRERRKIIFHTLRSLRLCVR